MNPRPEWVIMGKRKPLIVDLFSGAGGMSTGFEMAGFKVALGVELIPKFSETFAANHKSAVAICGDITKDSNDEISKKLKNKRIDVVVGGPHAKDSAEPVGEIRKIQKLSFMEFIRVVDLLKPSYFVMETYLVY